MSTANKLFQAASGGAGDSVYVEDVFSTYLYTGNGSTQTITNGIDLSGEGGLVWIKDRSSASNQHSLNDTERGATKLLKSNSSDSEGTSDLTAFNSDGFDVRYQQTGYINESGGDLVSWTFRKQAGFFDIKTFTAESDQFVTVNHDLGCNIGAVMFKETNGTGDWFFWHKSFSENDIIRLNTTAAKQTGQGIISSQTSSSAKFYTDANTTSTYVAYFFGDGDDSNAQIFGDNSDEAIIKCGSYTGNGSTTGPEINLGFEPQLLMIKASSGSTGNWYMYDSMRGLTAISSNDAELYPSSSGAEYAGRESINVTATGFQLATTNTANNANGSTYIYIAIRRPMKTPEAGTEVFKPVNQTGGSFVTSGFPVDLLWNKWDTAGQPFWWIDRIRGAGFKFLRSDGTDQEDSYSTNYFPMDYNNGVEDDWNSSGDQTYFLFRRATGFFDTVCYVADQTSSHNHNLGVTPEFAIIKQRNGSNAWKAYHSYLGNNQYLQPHTTNAAATDTGWASVNASTFFLKANNGNNIAYLWATVNGVSKVGSVVHSGTTNVDCGFSAGARFVLIKRTDSTGGWYVYDSARGIVAGNDPYYLLDDTSVEVTNTDYIDPLNAGFTLTSSFTAGTYIFLAIA